MKNLVVKGIIDKLDKFFKGNNDQVSESEVNNFLEEMGITMKLKLENGHIKVIR